MKIIKTISLDKKITINTLSLFLINATNFSLSIILSSIQMITTLDALASLAQLGEMFSDF